MPELFYSPEESIAYNWSYTNNPGNAKIQGPQGVGEFVASSKPPRRGPSPTVYRMDLPAGYYAYCITNDLRLEERTAPNSIFSAFGPETFYIPGIAALVPAFITPIYDGYTVNEPELPSILVLAPGVPQPFDHVRTFGISGRPASADAIRFSTNHLQDPAWLARLIGGQPPAPPEPIKIPFTSALLAKYLIS